MLDSDIPKHIAIIMDGNGRWAEKRFLPRVFGHKSGVEALRRIVKYSAQKGISCLTLYAFSSENWKRPEDEVGFLMNLLRLYIKQELSFLNKNQLLLFDFSKQRSLLHTQPCIPCYPSFEKIYILPIIQVTFHIERI